MGALILKGGLRIPHNNIALTGFYNPCLQRNFLFMGVGTLRTLTPLVPSPVSRKSEHRNPVTRWSVVSPCVALWKFAYSRSPCVVSPCASPVQAQCSA